jgi:hypothetical protein
LEVVALGGAEEAVEDCVGDLLQAVRIRTRKTERRKRFFIPRRL